MLSLDILKMIYFACVHSHLVYGIEIYANTHMKNINKLVILNNKILRILQNVSRDTHTVELYTKFLLRHTSYSCTLHTHLHLCFVLLHFILTFNITSTMATSLMGLPICMVACHY